MDYEGIKMLLTNAGMAFPRLSYLWLDGGYRGVDKGAHWVDKTLGGVPSSSSVSESLRPKRC